MKQFALPVVGLAVIAAYWLWRSTAPTPVPAAAAPASSTPAARPSSASTSRDAGDARSTPSTSAATPTTAPAPSAAEATTATRRDREQTRRLREQLRTMHRTGGSQGSAGAAEAAPADTLDATYIQARIREDLVPIAQECYESALEDDPKLGGKLVMNFSIVGDPSVGGVVDEADADPTSEITQPDLLECMKESMLSLSFPPPEDGGTVSVTYPFVFSADGPSPAKP